MDKLPKAHHQVTDTEILEYVLGGLKSHVIAGMPISPHEAENTVISAGDLSGNIATHQGLFGVIFLAIGMATVDHQTRWE